MTVNEFIVELQMLNTKLREKDIVIIAPNGLEVNPKVKQNIINKYDVFGGIENVKNIIITIE